MHGMKSCGCREHQRTSENAWDEILCNICLHCHCLGFEKNISEVLYLCLIHELIELIFIQFLILITAKILLRCGFMIQRQKPCSSKLSSSKSKYSLSELEVSSTDVLLGLPNFLCCACVAWDCRPMLVCVFSVFFGLGEALCLTLMGHVMYYISCKICLIIFSLHH